MQRRIFIAINLAENIKNKLQKCQQEWADLPVRFAKKDSLHLTLLFIGYVSDEQMLETCRKVREIAQKHRPFELNFTKIRLAPPGKSSYAKASEDRAPRLIWIEGEKSEALINLKRDIEKMMVSGEDKKRAFFQIDRGLNVFIPHITLARIRQMAWKSLDKVPEINKEVRITSGVYSIEVMESDMKPSSAKASKGRGVGVEYVILESAELG